MAMMTKEPGGGKGGRIDGADKSDASKDRGGKKGPEIKRGPDVLEDESLLRDRVKGPLEIIRETSDEVRRSDGVPLDEFLAGADSFDHAVVLPDNPLDIEVDSRPLREKLRPLEDFWRSKRVVPHKAARDRLGEIFSAMGHGVDFDYERIIARLREVDPSCFYSSGVKPAPLSRRRRITDHKDRSECDILTALAERIVARWRREKRIFLDVPPTSSPKCLTPIELALQCPRILDPKRDLDELLRLDRTEPCPEEAVRYQIMFSHVSQHILRKPKDYKHREAYILSQLATQLGEKAGKKVKIPGAEVEIEVPAPSVLLANRFVSTREVKEFIDLRISLLLPNKQRVGDRSLIGDNLKVVQEDFITCDLIALARETGLYEEYKPIFEALFYHRQLQFFRDFHLDPETPDRDRISLRALLQRAADEHAGQLPSLASFGCGNTLLEKILLSKRIVSRVDAVDKNEGVEEKRTTIDGNFKATSIPTRSGQESSISLREKVMAVLPEADVVVAADSLHESDNLKAYLIRLFREKVKPGGYLYISDPIHCIAVDDVTHVTLNYFDKTRHPSSMLSLEDYLEIISYLRTIGAEVEAINIIPGSYAGYGDGLARLNIVIKKWPDEAHLPYKVPEAFEATAGALIKDEDIFRVFPFNLITDERERKHLLDVIGRGFVYGVRSISFAEARPFVISRLLRSYSLAGKPRLPVRIAAWIKASFSWIRSFRKNPIVREYIEEVGCRPYPVDRLLEIADEPNDDLRMRNRTAADVIALQKLLKEKAGIDISEKLRKQPGWEYFV